MECVFIASRRDIVSSKVQLQSIWFHLMWKDIVSSKIEMQYAFIPNKRHIVSSKFQLQFGLISSIRGHFFSTLDLS